MFNGSTEYCHKHRIFAWQFPPFLYANGKKYIEYRVLKIGLSYAFLVVFLKD